MYTSTTSNMDRTKLIERFYHIGIWTCLITALLLVFLLATSYSANAQWSTDPASPMVVSSVPNASRYTTAIADADSGYYVFWSDLRNDPNKADLYGQHFDSDGNALWTPDGELLLSDPTKSINQMAPLLMPDGSLIISYLSRAGIIHGDTVRAMRFDADANALWAEPTVLLSGLDYSSLDVVASDSCAYVVAYCESCGGGGYGCKMQRVRMDGTVQFALPGQTTNSSYFGPYTIHPDGAGGVLFSIRASNGAGTALKAQRFDSLGAEVWPAYIDLADAQGLNYAFTSATDNIGALTAVYEVNGDLRMNRIDTLGTPLWSPTVQVATDFAVYVQQSPSAIAIDDHLYVVWSDNRPPAANLDLYIQQYDLNTGAELWAPDGVPAIQINSFSPRTGLVASDSGAVVATFDGNVDGYAAMRVRNDGMPAWPAPVILCTPAFNPYNERQIHLPDGNGGVVAFWEGFTGGLYGARVYRNGKLYDDVGIEEHSNTRLITAYPNPAQDRITFNLPAQQRLLAVDAVDTRGASVPLNTISTAGYTCDVSGLATGAYSVRLVTSGAVFTARIIKN